MFLSADFYRDYAHCAELEIKTDRPYAQVRVDLSGVLFAVPLRSAIKHRHVLWTDRANRCGLDFSKAAVVTNSNYIDATRTPYIRQNEFDALRGK
jgi:protein AbiQ